MYHHFQAVTLKAINDLAYHFFLKSIRFNNRQRSLFQFKLLVNC